MILGSLVAAALLLGAFIGGSATNPNAMMPLSFFKIPAFAAGNTVAFSVSLGMFSIFFFLQPVHAARPGYSAFAAGLRFLPMTLMIIVTAPISGRVRLRRSDRVPR